MVYVDARNDPFFSDSLAPGAGGKDGGHWVAVKEYKPGPPPMALVDNQWGSGSDRWVPVSELARSQNPPGSHETIEQLKQEVKANREKGTVDPALELELLRQQRMATDPKDRIDEKAYEKEVARVMKDALRKWEKQETAGGDPAALEAERQKTWVKLTQMSAGMPDGPGKTAMFKAIGTEQAASIKRGHNTKLGSQYVKEKIAAA
jgi:hypothetical protein